MTTEKPKPHTNIFGNVENVFSIGEVRGNVFVDPGVDNSRFDFRRIQGPYSSNEENFTELCNLLVSEEYGDVNIVKKVGNNDDGLDCFIGISGKPIHGFRHEYLLGRIGEACKQHIVESFIRACINYDLIEWTLCIPSYLLPKEQEWLKEDLPTLAMSFMQQMTNNDVSLCTRIAAVKISVWHQPKLLAMLLKYPHVAKIFFGASPNDTLSSPARLVIDWRDAKWDYHNNAVFVVFSIANTGGRIAIVEQISLEILDSYPCPESESPWVGAVMQEFRFDIDLNPEQPLYLIGEGMTFVYKNGDIDGFKLKLRSKVRCYYRLIVKVKWCDIEDKAIQITQTEPFIARFPRML